MQLDDDLVQAGEARQVPEIQMFHAEVPCFGLAVQSRAVPSRHRPNRRSCGARAAARAFGGATLREDYG